MIFDIKSELGDLMRQALKMAMPEHVAAPITLERPKQAAHGDFSCNLAMQLARELKKNPRDLAQTLLVAIPSSPLVEKVELAGAGFINFYINLSVKQKIIPRILSEAAAFGRSQQGGGKKVQIEFVSANPTGPLHIGHGRGAAYGASLCELMAFAGWKVTREYYVNDAGRQMDILALSAWLRYLDLQGQKLRFPRNAYQGRYVHDMAMGMKIAQGTALVVPAAEVTKNVPPWPDTDRSDDEAKKQREAHLDALIFKAKTLLGEDWNYVHNYVLTEQLSDCRSDLEEFGVRFDVWFSENALFNLGLVERCVSALEKAGHIYLQNGAKWFRSTAFGDEKDRVVQRDNGLYTYFASDIAYHLNKYERGFDRLINIWGADHHGYIPRVKGALKALGEDPARLDIALVQFAVLYKDGQKASMSTRSGEFITLRSLREEVGNDACRFFYVLRKSDQHLDFDIDLATSHSNENPVYYIQYAHARICSVLTQWGEAADSRNELLAANLDTLTHPHEATLVAKLSQFPEVIESAAADLSPHLIAFYLRELAADFHAYYNAERVLVEDESLQNARLALIMAVRQVIQNGLSILGVSHPASM